MKARQRRSDRALRGVLRSPGRPGVARREDRRRFWAAITLGLASEKAAAGVGVSPAVGARWFREAGGMPPSTLAPSSKPLSGRYLSLGEREEIALWRVQGHGVREIARRLGRAGSTISRELRRNAATRGGDLAYRASTAQWHAERAARRPKPARLALNAALRTYVQDRQALRRPSEPGSVRRYQQAQTLARLALQAALAQQIISIQGLLRRCPKPPSDSGAPSPEQINEYVTDVQAYLSDALEIAVSWRLPGAHIFSGHLRRIETGAYNRLLDKSVKSGKGSNIDPDELSLLSARSKSDAMTNFLSKKFLEKGREGVKALRISAVCRNTSAIYQLRLVHNDIL